MDRIRIAYVLVFLFLFLATIQSTLASDFFVYSVYRGLNLGGPEDHPEKDYYINMGSKHGIREGAILKVLRKSSTYDLQSQQLYRDLTFPIALVKVIHVESLASVARIEKFLPPKQTPVISPTAILVGDIVVPGEQN